MARPIKQFGNNSAASVPMAMDRLLSTGQAKSGQTALLIGFGAGLVYAGQVVTLESPHAPGETRHEHVGYAGRPASEGTTAVHPRI